MNAETSALCPTCGGKWDNPRWRRIDGRHWEKGYHQFTEYCTDAVCAWCPDLFHTQSTTPAWKRILRAAAEREHAAEMRIMLVECYEVLRQNEIFCTADRVTKLLAKIEAEANLEPKENQ